MTDSIFNSTFEFELRVLLLLSAARKKAFAIERIVSLDFIVCYAGNFQMPYLNPQGCVLSIRNPQNRKENSPVSYWEFLSFGKRHDFSSSGLRRGLPIVGQRMELFSAAEDSLCLFSSGREWNCFPRLRIFCASFSGTARPLHVKRSVPLTTPAPGWRAVCFISACSIR